jgi:hypothetical protein
MAQDQPVKNIQPDRRAMNGSVMPTRIPIAGKRSREVADSYRLKADVAEALFGVHRLEAIVEDLAVVVARVGRVTAGIGNVSEHLDHLEQAFGTPAEAVRPGPPDGCRKD